ncbi:MAG: hypothetical protein GXY77_01370 [Fibrobacter sp.]|nr:hypothetical protein [Fibrobacter sp.]
MNTQKGEPAFDNINELLSDQIIKRIRENVDSGHKEQTTLPEKEEQKPKNTIVKKTFVILSLLMVLILLSKKNQR